MADKKPAAIFPGTDSQAIFGTSVSNKGIQYKSRHSNTKISIQAPVKCQIANTYSAGSRVIVLMFEETIGLFKNGEYMTISVASNEEGNWEKSKVYEKGSNIATVTAATIYMRPQDAAQKAWNGTSWSGALVGTLDPTQYVDYSNGRDPNTGTTAATTDQTGTGDSTSPDGSGGGPDVGTIAKAAAFTTFFTMPGIFDRLQATHLEGQKSLLNDQPLLPFIEQLTGACLRHFMSTPSGDFFAFYPDYFGGLGKTAYWLIDDVEVISGSIELSDDNLATHVYVVGDTFGAPSGAESGSATVDWMDNVHTSGVVTIFNAFMADFLNGNDAPKDVVPDKLKVNRAEKPTLAKYEDAIAFLQKYGARPYYEPQATVRAPIYEAFLAYQKFCLKWSEQFKTQFEFTFMPELFPGGIIAFPEHGLQCYVASVTHNCSYENGFTTSAELMAPSAYKGNDGSTLDPDKSWVHAGMIRSWPTTDAVGKFEGATDTDPAGKVKP